MALEVTNMISGACLTCWDRTGPCRKYIQSLDENLKALERKVADLGCVYIDVNQLVERAEREGCIRKNVTDRWLTKVETLQREADEILTEGKKILDRKCLCGLCCWNCCLRYKQSYLAEAKRVEVEAELTQGGTFRGMDDVAKERADVILKRSLDTLHSKMDELRGLFETVKQNVESEKKRHRVQTPEVSGWLKRVEDLLGKQVQPILEEGELAMKESGQIVEDSQFQRNFPSYHGISKRINEKKAMLEEKLIEGHGFKVFTCKPEDPLIVEIPLEEPVGVEAIFKEVWNWVKDESIRCIGLYGMGGAGKTTLLDMVHNHFLQDGHDYDFAFRVVLSRPVNLDKIQEAILKKLKLPEDEWDNCDRSSRAAHILSLMKEKNFLLFLDDLWDRIDLQKYVGIPRHEHLKKCKIIFTTRDEGVCNYMQPDKKMEVKCLPRDEALKLFQRNLGKETCAALSGNPMIAEKVFQECKYLPLALIAVAKAMAGKIELKDWMKAEKNFKSRQSKVQDMTQEVLAILEFSYTNLPDETHKRCFLYLSIFPKGHEICEDDVIDLWIGEGFLDKYGDAHEARGYGKEIFRELRRKCLVEFVMHPTVRGEVVKMHDVIREMALWVRSEHGSKPNTVLVQEELKSFRLEELKKWKDAKWISLWRARGRFGDALTAVPCSHLSTLIVRDTSLRIIPDEFFLAIPCLRVLDLSNNHDLDYVPGSIWELANLRYLNLDMANGRIIQVPTKIKNLNGLVVLILSRNFVLPVEVIPNISALRVFYWSSISKYWDFETKGEIELLEKLQMMMHSVEEISVTLFSAEGVKKLFGCSDLLCCLRGLSLCVCDGLGSFKISISLLESLEHLQSLTLYCSRMRWIEITGEDEGSDRSPQGCTYVESLRPRPSSFASVDSFRSLRDVLIARCEELVDLTSLIYHAPFLELLHIEHCSSLSEVIVGDIEDSDVTNTKLFQCLEYLKLEDLGSLTRICRKALRFPSLKAIKVLDCSKLMELPLNCESAKTLQVIEGEEGWWEGLKWDDPASTNFFSKKFSSLSGVSHFD